jgi:chromosome segregation ATPase
MKEQLEKRLNDLKTEFQSGQKALAELQAKQNELQATLLRISGAIQVIEEELAKANSAGK